MDPDRDTGSAVDQYEFGMTFDIGDIGKVAIAYVKAEDETADDLWVHVPADPGQKQVKGKPAEYYLIMGDDADNASDRSSSDAPDTMLEQFTVLVAYR